MAQTVTFRPTPAQLLWLHRQRRERGIPVTTLVQLALEQAMGLKAFEQAMTPEDYEQAMGLDALLAQDVEPEAGQ
jgi:hypothetical protein